MAADKASEDVVVAEVGVQPREVDRVVSPSFRADGTPDQTPDYEVIGD